MGPNDLNLSFSFFKNRCYRTCYLLDETESNRKEEKARVLISLITSINLNADRIVNR